MYRLYKSRYVKNCVFYDDKGVVHIDGRSVKKTYIYLNRFKSIYQLPYRISIVISDRYIYYVGCVVNVYNSHY